MSASNTAKDIFATVAPKAVTLSELGAEVTVPVTLDPSYERGFAALYVGSIDEAGTVTASAYLGNDSGSLRTLVEPRGIGTPGFNKFESQHQTRKRVIKFAWGEPDATLGGSFVVVMVPESFPMTVPVLDKDGKPTGADIARTFKLDIVE